ncbi:MotA/TolQ/ExbB proton channel family protein [Akkermansiaceae bacterium]|nr:MotA/TolQ/ExbB proton channel family protein [Akkermansiaceae bacterium]
MSRLIQLTLLLALCAVSSAQTPVETAKADLAKAVKELGDTKKDYSDLRRALYRDINRLDDEALKLGRELRALEREEERRTATVKTLEREIDARKTDFNYSAGILSQYSKAFITRLHPGENQIYREEVEAIDQSATAAVDEPQAELSERMKVLGIGISRLGDIAGGHSFDGKALRNGSESVEGKLLVAGPSVFFTQEGGGFEGVATFAETGTTLPTVVAIKGYDGEITETLNSGHGELPFDGSMGKAIEVEAAQETLWETIEKGGYVGHAILLLGAISFLIAAFKVWEVSRFKVPNRRELNAILDDLLAGKQDVALKRAKTIPGEAGALVVIGVSKFYEKRRVLEESMFEKLVVIKPHLERFLPFLALTAAAGPLMGLLGTVLGIIKTFQAMALYGSGNQKNFTAGISEALITTAEGLIVAIPVLVVHGLLKSMVKAKFGEIEGSAIAIINGTTERGKGMQPVSHAEDPDDGGDDGGDDDVELVPTTA